MRFILLLFFIFLFGKNTSAQYYILKNDSLINLLRHTYTSVSMQRINIGFELMSRSLPGQPGFDSMKNVLISEAETSRNRQLMCEVYSRSAQAYLNYTSNNEYAEKAKNYINNCMVVANESGLEIYKVSALMKYATYYRYNSEKQKALDYNNQAIALATSLGNDSLLCEAYTSISYTWDVSGNKLSRFQSLLTAREFAEKSGDHYLITNSYINIAAFYRETEQYEKCKDYYILAIEKGRSWNEWHVVLNGMRGMGQSYAAERKTDMGLMWYNKAMSLADSLDFKVYKLNINLDLLNYYFNNESPQKGLAYLYSHPDVLKFINDFGISFELNKLYAANKENLNQFDSALYYMNIAAPYEYAQTQNYEEKFFFTSEWANILKEMGNKDAVKEKLLLAKSFADSAGDFDKQQDISNRLDSAYLAIGDYKNAYYYYSRYNFYKDTLDALGRQKDILNIEIENTNKRAEQQKLQEESRLRRRDNIEYMGITAAIATIFIVLVLFGVFRMSPAVIKALGFFAFIFLFEFITLLLDTQIHAITHGEPWKILAIKIILIAMLLPLHHWLEEKMLHYLTSKAHRLRFFGREQSDIN